MNPQLIPKNSSGIQNINKNSIIVTSNEDIGLINYNANMLASDIYAFQEVNRLSYKKRLLEIGCGYGNLYNFLKNDCDYSGIDVVKRFDACTLTDGNGIPKSILNKKFDVVYSCNVFQHLSLKQKRRYLK